VNIREEKEATMTRLLNGLNYEITNVIKLQHYTELKDIVYMAINMKQQLKRKGYSW